MSVDLFLRRPESVITADELSVVLSETEGQTDEIKFKKLGDDEFEMFFHDAAVCSVDLANNQIVLSTKARLTPYIEYLAARLADKLHATVYDPQEGRNIELSELTVKIEDLIQRHKELFSDKQNKMVFVSNKSQVDFEELLVAISTSIASLFLGMKAKLPESGKGDNFLVRVNDKDNKPVLMITCYKRLSSIEFPEQEVRITLLQRGFEEDAQKLVDNLSSALGLTFTPEEQY
ncbi:MAG: hypothetical protein Q7S03_03390 [bacterium]|nr:hypothetical protein [bacterium]